MKAWIIRVLAAMAVASVLSGCAGFGDAANVSDPAIYEVSPSD